ncbi:MAG: RnfABCDGE type electron transport complex subunit G [Eubacterium sp.]|nr:RnfABCDGE type electron transport complex subunit G [Eubacterium sp.]
MSKKQTSVVHDTVIITLITVVAGLLLGIVHGITAAPIAAQEAQAKADSQKEVFSDAASFKEVDNFDEKGFASYLDKLGLDQTTVSEVSEAEDANGNALGYVVDAANNEGYGGEIELMVGIKTDDSGNLTINGISFLSISETAGMGMKAEKPEFKDQFNNMNIGDNKQIAYTKNGKSADNEIDAISGCTITTNAVTKAVNGALAAVEYLEGGSAS